MILTLLHCFFYASKNGCHVFPQYPELLVASYNNNEDAPHEPDGVALVWNMKYKKGTPEYIFHCQVRKEYTCSCPTNHWHKRHSFKLNTTKHLMRRRQTVLFCSSSQRWCQSGLQSFTPTWWWVGRTPDRLSYGTTEATSAPLFRELPCLQLHTQ